MERIELNEQYDATPAKKLEWWAENMPAGSVMQPEYRYRRTYVMLLDVERPIEIPGDAEHCIVRLRGGDDIIVKESYDDLCIRLNDLENNMFQQEE